MARLTIVQTNFTAGEVSPRMIGRTDIARYQNGAELMENCWPLLHGGAKRRDGTLFCAATKFAAKRMRLATGALDEEGNPVTVSARELLAEADADIARAQEESKGFAAAAACFLQRGAA